MWWMATALAEPVVAVVTVEPGFEGSVVRFDDWLPEQRLPEVSRRRGVVQSFDVAGAARAWESAVAGALDWMPVAGDAMRIDLVVVRGPHAMRLAEELGAKAYQVDDTVMVVGEGLVGFSGSGREREIVIGERPVVRLRPGSGEAGGYDPERAMLKRYAGTHICANELLLLRPDGTYGFRDAVGYWHVSAPTLVHLSSFQGDLRWRAGFSEGGHCMAVWSDDLFEIKAEEKRLEALCEMGDKRACKALEMR